MTRAADLLSQIPGRTVTPTLPRLVEGEYHLDASGGISFKEAVKLIKSLPLECLAIFNADQKLVAAILISSELGRIPLHRVKRDLLKDAHVLHNHPSGVVLSQADFGAAAYYNCASLAACLPSGLVLTIHRPLDGWPTKEEMMEAHKAALKAAESDCERNVRLSLLNEQVKRLNQRLAELRGPQLKVSTHVVE